MSGNKKPPREKDQTTERKPDLRESVKQLVADLGTNEVAILRKDENNRATVISYVRIELEGDALQVINTSEDTSILHNALVNAAMDNRRALWNFISKALS